MRRSNRRFSSELCSAGRRVRTNAAVHRMKTKIPNCLSFRRARRLLSLWWCDECSTIYSQMKRKMRLLSRRANESDATSNTLTIHSGPTGPLPISATLEVSKTDVCSLMNTSCHYGEGGKIAKVVDCPLVEKAVVQPQWSSRGHRGPGQLPRTQEIRCPRAQD